MIKSNNFDELGLKISKEAKKQSREEELFALKNSDGVSDELIDKIVRQEREYREYLDGEIERQEEKLMEAKNER